MCPLTPRIVSTWPVAACLNAGSTAPVLVLILARVVTAVPLTEVNFPPMYAEEQSLPLNAIEFTVPLTAGAQLVRVNGAVALKLKMLLRVIVAPFWVRVVTFPTAYMVEPHGTSWRITWL